MSERTQNVPAYRLHKQSGQAIVTLSDGLGARRDVLLGRHGTAESRAEYARVIGEWEANGRRLPQPQSTGRQDLTVNELLLAYLQHAEQHYRRPDATQSDELHCIRSAMRPLKELYGHTPAGEFGPLALKAARQKMIATVGPTGRPWSRRFVNASVGRIKAMFKWAVENEMVPVAVYQGLLTVRGLQKGRSEARETGPVKPVPQPFVDAILPHVTPPVRAMIDLQLLSGMRPGEVVLLRAIDIDMTGKVWLFRPAEHKTAWRGHDRTIALGPRAQEIVRQHLKPSVEAFLFSPREAMEALWQERRKRRRTKVQPSQVCRKKARPKRKPGERYTVDSYRAAIQRGIEVANRVSLCDTCKVPGVEQLCKACQAKQIPQWHPHQLRHAKATEIRREAGLDAARAVLGHRTPAITEVYAEIDIGKAAEVMQKLG
jgi:integrase